VLSHRRVLAPPADFGVKPFWKWYAYFGIGHFSCFSTHVRSAMRQNFQTKNNTWLLLGTQEQERERVDLCLHLSYNKSKRGRFNVQIVAPRSLMGWNGGAARAKGKGHTPDTRTQTHGGGIRTVSQPRGFPRMRSYCPYRPRWHSGHYERSGVCKLLNRFRLSG